MTGNANIPGAPNSTSAVLRWAQALTSFLQGFTQIGPDFLWSPPCDKAVPASTTITGAYEITFFANVTGNCTIIVVGKNFQNTTHVALNSTDLGTMTDADHVNAISYEIYGTNLVNGSNTLQFWTTDAIAGKLVRVEVWRNFLKDKIDTAGTTATWGDITGTGKPDDNADVTGSHESAQVASIAGNISSELVDDANLGDTSAWGGIPDIPNTISGHQLADVVQPILPDTSGNKGIWASDSGGATYATQIYGPEMNCYGEAAEVSPVTLTGSYQDIGSTVDLGNPGVPCALFALFVCHVRLVTGVNGASGHFLYSTDGGGSWTASGANNELGPSGTVRLPYSDMMFIPLDTPTGNIQVRYEAYQNTGTGTSQMVDAHKCAMLLPNANGALLGSTLTASIPSTAAASCTATYPSTTCQAHKSITVTYSGGVSPVTFANAIVSGGTESGTITSGATSQTFTVTSETQTGTSGGTSYTDKCNSVVTDSTTPTAQTATTSDCTVTFTFYAGYDAISQSLTATTGSCHAASGSCAATGYDNSTPAGGNGTYTYSWSITDSSGATITSGATAHECTIVLSHAVPSSGTTFEYVAMQSVVNDSVSTGADTATNVVTMQFRKSI
jgi:hypothetical protein